MTPIYLVPIISEMAGDSDLVTIGNGYLGIDMTDDVT